MFFNRRPLLSIHPQPGINLLLPHPSTKFPATAHRCDFLQYLLPPSNVRFIQVDVELPHAFFDAVSECPDEVAERRTTIRSGVAAAADDVLDAVVGEMRTGKSEILGLKSPDEVFEG